MASLVGIFRLYYKKRRFITRAVRHRVEVSAPFFLFASRLSAHARACNLVPRAFFLSCSNKNRSKMVEAVIE